MVVVIHGPHHCPAPVHANHKKSRPHRNMVLLIAQCRWWWGGGGGGAAGPLLRGGGRGGGVEGPPPPFLEVPKAVKKIFGLN